MTATNQTQTQTTTGTTTKDHSYITKLPTFADRGQAIAKRLESVKADPKYQALPEEKKAKVRADLYEKYVPASYSGFHLPVPDKDTWVGATGRDTTFRVPKTADEKLSATYRDPRNKQFGQDFMVGADKALSGIELFGGKVTNKAFSALFDLDQHYSHGNDDMLHQAMAKFVPNVKRGLENFIDARKAQIQSDDFWLQTHPRDTVIGRLGSSAGEIVSTLPLYEALGTLGVGAKAVEGLKGLSLTAKLAKTPVGGFVAKRLVTATDIYLYTLAESGGSNKEAAIGAASVATGESLLVGAGKVVKVAAAPLIKKWTANIVAMGGKPFAEDIAQSAAHEVEQEIHHTEKGEGEQINRIKAFYAEREKFDPIIAKLHEGEKVSQNSIALQMFKKNLNQLSKDQRSTVFMKRVELIHQAAQEAPVHLPDLYKNEVESEITKARKGNPDLHKNMAMFEQKYGIKFADTATENGLAQVSKETGISNTRGASKKLAKAAPPTKSVGADLNTGKASYSYADSRGRAIAEFRAPRNRVTVSHLVSDRSKLTLNNFIDNLKGLTPDIKFEDPAHMMLYHYGNAEKLPEGVKSALQYRFKQVAGYENSTPASLRQEAGMLHAHLRQLGYSGQLLNEGNVYRSTNTKGPYSWTVWQRELSDEVIDKAIEPAQKALKNHPDALKSFNSSINELKKTRPKLKTAKDVIDFENNIGIASRKIAAHVSGQSVPLQ